MGRITINYISKKISLFDDQEIEWKKYFDDVLADFREMKDQYPFSYLTVLPTTKPQLAKIRVVAANKDLIEAIGGVEADFLGKYSKELYIIVPIYHRLIGCTVYGGKWLKTKRLKKEDIHFYPDRKNRYGFQLCVGTPDSFWFLKNVILENVRTAENMLVAYERIMTGSSDKLELIAYSHGDKGREEFYKNRARYMSKR